MHPGPGIAVLAGATVTVSPYVFSFGDLLGVLDRPGWLPVPQFWMLAAGCVVLAIGGLTMNATRVWDQGLVTAGVAAIVLALAPALTQRPSLALAILLIALYVIFESWESDAPFQLRSRALIPKRSELSAAAARAAAMTAVAGQLTLVVFFRTPENLYSLLGLTAASAFLLRWSQRVRAERRAAAILASVVAFASPLMLWFWSPIAAHALMLAVTLWLVPSPESRSMADSPEVLRQHPAVPLVSSFALLCAGGTLLLLVPAATTAELGISAVDAVFTAVSSVCVTGLIVLDTPNDFTPLGQGIILLLIQLGALGIMSYSAAILISLGRRMGLRQESMVASSLNAADRAHLRVILKRMLQFTFTCEGVGAILLGLFFWSEGDRAGQAIWRGLFTAISAFCNAGFALQSDSLIPYQSNPWILHVVAVLIILGGLSPVVAFSIPGLVRRKERSAQVKIILSVSAILLFACFVLIAALEWNGALRGLSPIDRINNAWFQSVTLRTAGFNSVSFEALHPTTIIIMVAAMFIGGSPGGTAGGIKTTTAAVMALAVMTAVQGRREATVFGKRIPTTTVDRAAAITTIGALSLLLTLIALLLTQAIPGSWALFEAGSALATVGLSLGATAHLDSVGKIIIIVAMFAGRVGPLSLFAFLATLETRRDAKRPAEAIDVG